MPIPSRDEILRVLRAEPAPMKLTSIAALLRVKEADAPGLLRLLDDMCFSGQITGFAGQMFGPSSAGFSVQEVPHRNPKHAPPNGPVDRTTVRGAESGRARKESERPAKGRKGERSSPPKPLPKVLPKSMPSYTTASTSSKSAPAGKPKKGFAPPGPESTYVKKPINLSPGTEVREGIFSAHARGFGFVSSPLAQGDDVFVEEDRVGAAMHRDRVKVAILRRTARGLDGEILEVLERGSPRVAGVLRRKRGSAFLEPDDVRIRGPIPLRDPLDLLEGEGNSGNDGDAAIVRITRFPEFPREVPEGKIEQVLGRPGELTVEVQKILAMAQIDETHSDESFREAEEYGKVVPEAMMEGREDLTHLPLPTIDPEDARDHDDAVWVERLPEGGYKAWIAIADVSSYVRPGTKLDEEALKRGCSVYLPDRAIPMLPRPLSSNLCSLLPDELRLCLCAEVLLDENADVRGSRLIRGIMKSQAKLTYGGVARALGLTELPPRSEKAEELLPGLKIADELSMKLRKKRMDRGAMDFTVPEAKIVLNDKKEPVTVERRGEDLGVKHAYQLIEELMLLANEVVAEWLVGRHIPTVFRVHAAPDQEKLLRFATMCDMLGVQFDAEDALEPKRLSKIIRGFADHPKANVLNMLLLRSMKQAAYDTANIGHFGLASRAYVHFTSPIRRYPDLVVHRAVHAAILGTKPAKDRDSKSELQEAAFRSSTNERRVMEAERDVGDLYKTFLMKDHLGETHEGTVTGFSGSGAYIALDDPFVDVLVKNDALGGDSYELSEDNLRLVGQRSGDAVQLGDRMMVEIVEAAILRRQTLAKRLGGEGITRDARAAGGGNSRFGKSQGGRGRGKGQPVGGRGASTSRDGKPASLNGKPGKTGRRDKKKKGGAPLDTRRRIEQAARKEKKRDKKKKNRR